MVKQNIKLILRAFNGECDAARADVSWNNIQKMEERIRKACEDINKLSGVLQITITPEYLNVKLNELRVTHELEERKYQDREEQRRIREQIREEERAQRELEKAREDAEAEEQLFAETSPSRARFADTSVIVRRLLSLQRSIRPIRQNRMLLKRLRYDIVNLLHGDDGVAVCHLDTEPLKATIIELLNRGLSHLVLESTDGSYRLLAATGAAHEGNFVGDAIRWSHEHGEQFYIKRTGDEFQTPTLNSFPLPDGRLIEIAQVWVRASNFTHWGLANAKVLPTGYVRI
jgi:hypothetical protein